MSLLDLRKAFEGPNGSEHRLLVIVVDPEDQELLRDVWRRILCAGEAVPQ